MAAMNRFLAPQGPAASSGVGGGVGGGGGYGPCKVEEGVHDQFPIGLRVLVVDDDPACLRILEQMLRKCQYQVTTCRHARMALSLLRERKGGFDLVISDVHMPDMDGFKLLELVGLEMDLPVIMMSADGKTSAVMRGIKHGACDYLIKPVRMEELKNIWQHVVRKKWNGSKDNEHSGSLDDSDRQRRGAEEDEYASSVNDGTDSSWKVQKKKREVKEDEDDGDQDNDDSSAAKKPRVVWSVELHQQFVSAVNQLGIDKAVPKRILELMNVPGLTRENVASHLQKFRLYLKRLSGVTQSQGGIANPFCGPIETNSKANALGRLDFQAAAASVHIPSHAMTALHAELLGRPSGAVILSELEQSTLMHSGPRYLSAERGIAFGQPLVKCQSGVQKLYPPSSMVLGDMPAGFSTWSPNLLASSCQVSNRLSSIAPSGSNLLAQQMSSQNQSRPILSESTHGTNVRQEAQPINVQPSCLITPSQSSDSYSPLNNANPVNAGSMALPSLPSVFQAGGASMPIIPGSSLNDGMQNADYSLMPSQLNSLSQDVGKLADGEQKCVTMHNDLSDPATGRAVSSALAFNEEPPIWKMQNLSTNFVFAPSSSLPGYVVDFTDVRNPVMQKGNYGYVGRGMSIPSRFAIDDIDSHSDSYVRKEANYNDDGARGRQEIHLDVIEGAKLDTATMAHSSSSDLMSILSK